MNQRLDLRWMSSLRSLTVGYHLKGPPKLTSTDVCATKYTARVWQGVAGSH